MTEQQQARMLEQYNLLLQEAATAVADIENIAERIRSTVGYDSQAETDLVTAKALVLKVVSVVVEMAVSEKQL